LSVENTIEANGTVRMNGTRRREAGFEGMEGVRAVGRSRGRIENLVRRSERPIASGIANGNSSPRDGPVGKNRRREVRVCRVSKDQLSSLENVNNIRVIQNSNGILSEINQEGGVPVIIDKKVSGPKTTIIKPVNSLNKGGLLLSLTAEVTFFPFSLKTTSAGGSKAPLAIQFTTLDNRIAPNMSIGAKGRFGWIGSRSGERYGTYGVR
jgi:hypothetical protein